MTKLEKENNRLFMKQRIITGLILLVVASLWLFSSYEWFLAGSFLVLIVKKKL